MRTVRQCAAGARMSLAYVVTSGSYSDYGITAVFSTREAADRYCAWQNGPEAASRSDDSAYRVEEYELDVPFEPHGCFVFTIREPHPKWPDWHHAHYECWSPTSDPHTPARFEEQTEWTGRGWTGYGETKEHARRSAEELRRRMIAQPWEPR